ncbi:Alpha/Beta hydrolase protein [Leptodontidium sp. 2 PMI_412]|nr:Alpha/Beta hydrolase protein [Leptodontidium sp. 2 PMI_412]
MVQSNPPIDWSTGSKSALVSIGTHSLHLSISGPLRPPNTPLIVLMTGHSSSTLEWAALIPLIAPFARILTYDRSGLGKSETKSPPPTITTAVSVAQELSALLKAADIPPPYIMLAHSWGGILAREFLHLHPTDIVGMVFVDANSEHTFANPSTFPYPCMNAIQGSVSYIEATGLAADTILSQEQGAAVMQENTRPGHLEAEKAEAAGFHGGDFDVLQEKRQLETHALGKWPVSVIHANGARDFQAVYDAGVAAGNGTEEERRLFREFIADLVENGGERARRILDLSSDERLRRFRETKKSGHNVQMLEPELIADEVRCCSQPQSLIYAAYIRRATEVRTPSESIHLDVKWLWRRWLVSGDKEV